MDESKNAEYPTLNVIGSGWVTKLDRKLNEKFFYNRRTRKGTWTEPEVELLPPDYTERTTKLIPTSTGNWIKVFSSDFDRVYYFNKVSRTSVWDNPEPENKELRSSVAVIDSKLRETEAQRVEHSLRLAEAVKRLENDGMNTDNSDRFTVRKNLAQYKANNDDFEKTSLWRINNEKSDSNEKPDRISSLREEYQSLYDKLKSLIDKNKGVKEVSELDTYAEDLRKRTEDMYKKFDISMTKIDSQEENDQVDADVEVPVDEEKPAAELSVAEKKKRHKLRVLQRRKREREEKKNNSLALFIDELEQKKEEKKAIEAEAAAKREARKKFEQLRLLKGGKGDFYKLLGIEKNATSGKIKKAYLKLMIVYHPDKNKRRKVQGQETLTEKETTERANLIKDAYQTLSNKWERFVYDTIGLEQYLIYQKIVQAFKNYIMSGVKIKKHGRRGRRVLGIYKPKPRYLWLGFNHEFINTGVVRILEITSEKERKAVKGIKLTDIKNVKKGISTEVFKRTGTNKLAGKYFSIIGQERTLDIECDSPNQREFLCSRINLLRIVKQKDEEAFKEHVKNYPFNKKKKGKQPKNTKPNTKRKKIVRKVESSDSESDFYDTDSD